MSQARVEVDGEVSGAIARGLVVFLGVAREDTAREAEWMAQKIANLRIFEDAEGKMNRSVLEIGGAVLLVSQFTLLADVRRGRRPSFIEAAPPEEAERLYQTTAEALRGHGVPVERGVFQAHMAVHLINDGPVTLIVDTPPSASS